MGYIGNSVVGVEHPSTSALNATTGDFTGAVDIDGAITSSTGATITTADNTSQLVLKSTDADATEGPRLDFHRDSSSPADGDVAGVIRFLGDDDGGNTVNMAELEITLDDITAGSDDATIKFHVMNSGTRRNNLKIGGSEVIINEDSVNLDFRVESNGNASMLFVDGGEDRIGFGEQTPEAFIHASKSSTATSVNKTASSVDDPTLVIENLADTNGNYSGVQFSASGSSATTTVASSAIYGFHEGRGGTYPYGHIAFYTTNSAGAHAEKGRFLSNTTPHFLVGCTSEPSSSVAGTAISTTSAGSFQSFSSTTNASTHAAFGNTNGVVGSIQTTNSTTAFNTSSDYRLKENVNYTWDATTRLKQLKPVRFNFIANADTIVDGFLAHEVSGIVPEAITGTKDEIKIWKDGEELPDGVSVGDNKLDDDGNTIPIMQGIDQSKLVPLLVKTIQEAVIKIETLEAKVTALENA